MRNTSTTVQNKSICIKHGGNVSRITVRKTNSDIQLLRKIITSHHYLGHSLTTFTIVMVKTAIVSH
jgi:hypothetical protein